MVVVDGVDVVIVYINEYGIGYIEVIVIINFDVV